MDRPSILQTVPVLHALAFAAVFGVIAQAWGQDRPDPLYETVVSRAGALALEPYAPPEAPLPEVLRDLTYDQYRDIRFRRAHALWRDEALLEVQLFHLGFLYQRPVTINVIEDGQARRVAYDPGMFDYGGNEFGARHEGLRESHLTLDIAQRVKEILAERLPETRVLLTRHGDEVVSLERRVAFANAVSADAFVSIHLNAADDPVEHGGVVTFVLDHTNDRQAIRLAARENQTSTAEVSGLQRILAQLHRTEQVGESRALARLVQIGTLAGGRRVLPDLPDRGVKSGMFYVLVGARMPAILLEASFLTQPEEHQALRTERYRQSLAEGIAEGVVRYARGE